MAFDNPPPRRKRRERGAETVSCHPDRASFEREQMIVERPPDVIERAQETAMHASLGVPLHEQRVGVSECVLELIDLRAAERDDRGPIVRRDVTLRRRV